MRIIQGKTFAEAYNKALLEIYKNPEYLSAPRGKKIKEILNLVIEIENPLSNLYKNEIRGVPEKYLAGELFWYFSGKNDLDFIKT